MRNSHLSESEKELLNVLGTNSDMTLKQLVDRTQYKRVNTIIKKIEEFKNQGILYGPFHEIDYSKLCKNFLRTVICILELAMSYETVVSYLTLIEPIRRLYPVLSPRKEFINTLFLTSDVAELKCLFQMLTENGVLADYTVRIPTHKKIMESPNFFGDPTPSLDNLLDSCTVPDMSLGSHDTTWNACDISILNYFRTGYKGGKLIEILKAEKKLNKSWTYEQIKYSHRKMLKNGLIKKRYFMFPFSYDQCTDFNLYVKTEDRDLTQRIIYNFARGERVSKEYMLCEEWGYVGFASHPQFLTGLMPKLNRIDEIVEKEIYPLRSVTERGSIRSMPLVLEYFDVDNQTLYYPYHVYQEKIKEKSEHMRG
jgi:hypothetical protein